MTNKPISEVIAEARSSATSLVSLVDTLEGKIIQLVSEKSALNRQLAAERARVVKLPDIRIVRVAGQEIKMYHAATLREYLSRSGIPVEGE